MGELWKQRKEWVKEIREENALARVKRSDTQQLEALDHRLGAGVGAKLERARLAKSLEDKRVKTKS